MAFWQLTHRKSLSHTMMCLKVTSDKMYPVGIGEVVTISSITKTNESRSLHIIDYLINSFLYVIVFILSKVI